MYFEHNENFSIKMTLLVVRMVEEETLSAMEKYNRAQA